jgi:hypothetical protein
MQSQPTENFNSPVEQVDMADMLNLMSGTWSED